MASRIQVGGRYNQRLEENSQNSDPVGNTLLSVANAAFTVFTAFNNGPQPMNVESTEKRRPDLDAIEGYIPDRYPRRDGDDIVIESRGIGGGIKEERWKHDDPNAPTPQAKMSKEEFEYLKKHAPKSESEEGLIPVCSIM